MKYSVSASFHFEAAHRLPDAYSKQCVENLHGHSYVAIITVTSAQLNEDGMVIDFGLLKDWWKQNFSDWDHAVFLHDTDQLAAECEDMGNAHVWDVPPTAENMAAKILERLQATDFRPQGGLYSVSVQETKDNLATVYEAISE